MRFFRNVDKIFLSIVILLTVGGFLIFSSASLGLLAKEQYDLQQVLSKQFLFGVVGGFLMLTVTTAIHYRVWRRYALVAFIVGILVSLLTFVPGISREINGAHRWIGIGGITFQPAEVLKVAYVIYMATYFSGVRHAVNEWKQGLAPFLGVTFIVMLIMYFQKDTDGLVVMMTGAFALFFATGVRWKTLAIVLCLGLLGVGSIVASREYLRERVMGYLVHSEENRQGSGWQAEQAQIAIGSGGVSGRGYGQSIQKFEHLPEATSDSIFAVFAEEFGFIGSVGLLFLFFLFMLRGYYIASHARDTFGMLFVVGVITMILAQVCINIASMIDIIPVAGLTLPFVSLGGTSLLVTLATLGIVLSVSKHVKRAV